MDRTESALHHIIGASVINVIPFTVTRTACTAVLLQAHYKTHSNTHSYTHQSLLQCTGTEQEVKIDVQLVMATPLMYQHTNYFVSSMRALSIEVALGKRGREELDKWEWGQQKGISIDRIYCGRATLEEIMLETEGRLGIGALFILLDIEV